MFLKCFLFFCILQVSLARSAGSNSNEIDENSKSSSHSRSSGISSYMNELKSMYKTYQDCSKDDVSTCLKIKLISSMDSAFRSLENVEIIKGITFEKDQNVETTSAPLQLEKIEESLPRSLDEKESVLNGIIMQELVSFLNSHTLKIKFPSKEDTQRSVAEENRGKKNKGSMIMIPLLLGGTFIPMAYGALALLAGKALIVSKLALVLASIIGIKKLVSGSNGHHESSHEVVVGHGHSGWGRNSEIPHNLAYSEYVPKPV